MSTKQDHSCKPSGAATRRCWTRHRQSSCWPSCSKLSDGTPGPNCNQAPNRGIQRQEKVSIGSANHHHGCKPWIFTGIPSTAAESLHTHLQSEPRAASGCREPRPQLRSSKLGFATDGSSTPSGPRAHHQRMSQAGIPVRLQRPPRSHCLYFRAGSPNGAPRGQKL